MWISTGVCICKYAHAPERPTECGSERRYSPSVSCQLTSLKQQGNRREEGRAGWNIHRHLSDLSESKAYSCDMRQAVEGVLYGADKSRSQSCVLKSVSPARLYDYHLEMGVAVMTHMSSQEGTCVSRSSPEETLATHPSSL